MGDATCAVDGCAKPVHCRGMCKRDYERRRTQGLIEVRRFASVEDRFWAKVDPHGCCWEWTAGTDSDGYGTFRDDQGRTIGAHQFAWMLLVGPVPDGLELDHLCFNRRCVFPEHLEPVTHEENIRRQVRWRRVFCLRGHRLADNRYRSGRPRCRACTRADNLARAHRIKPPTERIPITHCWANHEFTPENTYVQRKKGGSEHRQCRKCKAVNQRQHVARRNGAPHDDGACEPVNG